MATLDDWCLTGFLETVRIFGAKAMERQSLDHVEAMLRQQSLPFISDRPDRSAEAAGTLIADRVAEIEREADGEGDSLPSSASFSGSDFGKIVGAQ